MNMYSRPNSTDEIENQLERELRRLEQIFDNENHMLERSMSASENDSSTANSRPQSMHLSKRTQSYSEYEIARAEGEREELNDKLQVMISK